MTEYKYSCNIDDGMAAVIGPSSAQSVTDVGQHTEHWAPDEVPNIGHTQTLIPSGLIKLCQCQPGFVRNIIMLKVAVDKNMF